MRKILCFAAPGLLLGALVTWAQPARPRGIQNQRRALEVELHYTGSGTVDENHKIFVALWDSADFVDNGSAPIAVERAISKDSTVSFPDVSKTPVYVSATFDPSGQWDARSAPPPDASLGVLSKAPPKPDAIDIPEGQTVKVTLTFDDSVKVH